MRCPSSCLTFAQEASTLSLSSGEAGQQSSHDTNFPHGAHTQESAEEAIGIVSPLSLPDCAATQWSLPTRQEGDTSSPLLPSCSVREEDDFVEDEAGFYASLLVHCAKSTPQLRHSCHPSTSASPFSLTPGGGGHLADMSDAAQHTGIDAAVTEPAAEQQQQRQQRRRKCSVAPSFQREPATPGITSTASTRDGEGPLSPDGFTDSLASLGSISEPAAMRLTARPRRRAVFDRRFPASQPVSPALMPIPPPSCASSTTAACQARGGTRMQTPHWQRRSGVTEPTHAVRTLEDLLSWRQSCRASPATAALRADNSTAHVVPSTAHLQHQASTTFTNVPTHTVLAMHEATAKERSSLLATMDPMIQQHLQERADHFSLRHLAAPPVAEVSRHLGKNTRISLHRALPTSSRPSPLVRGDNGHYHSIMSPLVLSPGLSPQQTPLQAAPTPPNACRGYTPVRPMTETEVSVKETSALWKVLAPASWTCQLLAELVGIAMDGNEDGETRGYALAAFCLFFLLIAHILLA